MPGFAINGGSGPSPTAESIRAHRWNILITGIQGADKIQLYAATCSRPSFEFDQIIVHNSQNEIYLPGKYRFGVVTIKFYDIVSGASTSDVLRKWWSTVVANYSTHSLNMPNNNINGVKKGISTSLLDGKGAEIYGYDLIGAWPVKIDPSELDYASSEIATVSAQFRFDGVEERVGNIDQHPFDFFGGGSPTSRPVLGF